MVTGVRVDGVNPSDLLRSVDTALACGRSHIISFLAVDPIVLAHRDPQLSTALNACDLNLPDGMPLSWALRTLGVSAERVAGTDAMNLVCEWGRSRQLRHFFFGGTPGLLERLQAATEMKHPGMMTVGVEAPPFGALEAWPFEHYADRIRATGAQAVWVGLGTPKQHFAAIQLRELEAAPIIFCVGAAFDFAAGTKKRAPEWMRDSGLEWLHRLGSEPRRLWRRYLYGNPAFIVSVLTERLRMAVQHLLPTP
jgi:N-acetylglucosaminyldiphosphoundecaprenol N-acetyl-beta-D-mannosaminyltransferase